jgi:hypothetical protein
VIDVVEEADAAPGFAVAVTGNFTRDHDFNLLSERDLQNGELQFGLPAALIILLLVFGTLVAGFVPLLMAIVAIVTALGLVALLTQIFDLSIFTTNMLTGMGLALGIDYALFVISRYREERGRGRGPDDAILAAGATANRAVLFSGSAFVVAMFGLLISPRARSSSGSRRSPSRRPSCRPCSGCSTTASTPAGCPSSAGARSSRPIPRAGSGARSSTASCDAPPSAWRSRPECSSPSPSRRSD